MTTIGNRPLSTAVRPSPVETQRNASAEPVESLAEAVAPDAVQATRSGTATTSATNASPAPLHLGDRGPLVVALQQKLVARGAQLNPTGQFDQPTQLALKTLQKGFGLPQTGVVDPATASALEAMPDEALKAAHAAAGDRAAVLGAAAEEEARRRNTQGACAAGVYHALENAGLEPGMAVSDAYLYGEKLASRSDMKEITGLTAKELQALPPGAILVYGKSAAHTHGHVAIVTDETLLGEALEASDHLQRIHLMAGAASYGNDFGAGPTEGARFRVFIPLDGDP